MKRREFLKTAGCFVASAGMGGLGACGDDDDASPTGDAGPGDAGAFGRGDFAFPQGVASGDPRPDSVMLWTRAVPAEGDADVPLTLTVARDRGLEDGVLELTLRATSESDHTVRVLLEDLDPDTIYYYRFSAGVDDSTLGRTRTAPAPDADREVRLAWVSCQDYASGFHGGYRHMINRDEDADDDEQLDFVLHVGDFIYETIGESFQTALDENLERTELVTQDGEMRVVPPFPSGGGELSEGGTFAKTLDDYRHLYKVYLSDPDLQAARARWPFVCVWDDHEFSDDCWQSQANYSWEHTTDEPAQTRRVAASRAWFEFVPAILSESEAADGVPARASDFADVDVEDEPFDETVEVDEPNNLDAIGAITIYRRLRFGKHVDLLLTDSRSYRSDHPIAEQTTVDNILIFHPRGGVPLEAVVAFDAGREANGGSPPATVNGLSNTRMDSPPGTLLGSEQKAWLKQALQASDATFKLWGNPVPLLRLRMDSSDVALIPEDRVLQADGWDGYPGERNELMKFLRDNDIRDVVSLSGDHHAHFAGLVYDDFDSDAGVPAMIDFAAAGISSNSQLVLTGGAIKESTADFDMALVEPVIRVIFYDGTPFGDERKAVPNLNTLLRYGSAAANVAADTHDIDAIEAARDPDVNPHVRYADTTANGYGLCTVRADRLDVTLVTTELPIVDRGREGAREKGRARFVVMRTGQGESPTLEEPELEGARPFPLA